MIDLYLVRVKFFKNDIREKVPNFSADMVRYLPHLVVKGDDEYLGVNFVDGGDCEFDEENDMIVESIYEGVGYHKLVEGAEFFIMEGPHVVGEGIVTDSCKEKEWKG